MANYYAEDSSIKLDWAMPFQRTGKFPLDRSSMFGSYADAVKYAKGDTSDPDERGLCGSSYIGQQICVYENDTITYYKIDADRTLKDVVESSIIELKDPTDEEIYQALDSGKTCHVLLSHGDGMANGNYDIRYFIFFPPTAVITNTNYTTYNGIAISGLDHLIHNYSVAKVTSPSKRYIISLNDGNNMLYYKDFTFTPLAKNISIGAQNASGIFYLTQEQCKTIYENYTKGVVYVSAWDRTFIITTQLQYDYNNNVSILTGHSLYNYSRLYDKDDIFKNDCIAQTFIKIPFDHNETDNNKKIQITYETLEPMDNSNITSMLADDLSIIDVFTDSNGNILCDEDQNIFIIE